MLCEPSCYEKQYDGKQLREKRVYLTYRLCSRVKGSQSGNSTPGPGGELKERPRGNAVYWVSTACSAPAEPSRQPLDFVSYITQGYLPRGALD